MKSKNQPELTAGIVIKGARERDLLFASLYMAHGMWSASFNVNRNGRITANERWWRKRKIFSPARVLAVLSFCEGWRDGRRAEEIKKECEAFSRGNISAD